MTAVPREHRIRGEGVELHVEECGSGEPAVLLVHGIACDGRYMTPLARHLCSSRRTVWYDLRGHGRSDAPDGPYEVETHLDDLVAVCNARGIERPVVIGHSLGGVLAVILAGCRPDFPAAVVALDAPIVPPAGREIAMRTYFDRLRHGDYSGELQRYFSAFFAPGDDPELTAWVMSTILEPPSHAVIPTWEHANVDRDTAACVADIRVPLLYIDAGTPNTDLERMARLCPQLVIGRVVGSGHFLQLMVPDQVNAMIDRFLALLVGPVRNS